MNRKTVASLALSICALVPAAAFAQCAGCDADQNKADREEVERQAVVEEIEKNDPPLRPDPVGNALIGGAVAGVRGGAAAAASSTARGAATGAAVETVKEEAKDAAAEEEEP